MKRNGVWLTGERRKGNIFPSKGLLDWTYISNVKVNHLKLSPADSSTQFLYLTFPSDALPGKKKNKNKQKPTQNPSD